MIRFIVAFGVSIGGLLLGLGVARSMWVDAITPVIESLKDGRLDTTLIAAGTFDCVVAMLAGYVVFSITNSLAGAILRGGE